MKRSQLCGCLGVCLMLAQACGPARIPVSTPSPAARAQALSAATPTLQPPPLIPLTSELGKYVVELPASEGILDYSVTSQLLGEPTECHITFSQLGFAYVVVEYCDLASEAVAARPAPDVLLQSRDDLLRPFRVQVMLEQAGLTDAIYPALALSGRADMRGQGLDGSFDARMILVDERLYIILMAASDGDLCGCAALSSRVMHSLHVQPDLSIPFEPAH